MKAEDGADRVGDHLTGVGDDKDHEDLDRHDPGQFVEHVGGALSVRVRRREDLVRGARAGPEQGRDPVEGRRVSDLRRHPPQPQPLASHELEFGASVP